MSNAEICEENQKDEEPFGLGCALESFSEVNEVFEMINNLKTLEGANLSAVERAYERFIYILEQYHEQPHLLDPHLERLLEKFIAIVRNPESTLNLKHATFKYMHVVINVRGYKVIVRHLPHEVADFEPVLKLLESQDKSESDTWTTRYVLLLWLSIIVMIPFHMSRLDAFDKEDETQQSTMCRVLNVCKTYALVTDKCRDVAAFLVSRFLTRVDVKELYMSSFFTWACELSVQKDSSVFVKYGTLASVAMVLKNGKREDLLPHATKLLQWIINSEFKNNPGSNVQKLVYKIIQRIGLTFLPPRVATWRYKRGNRSLAANMSAGDGKPNANSVNVNTNNIEEPLVDDNIEVPDEIEEVIDQLIQGLSSNDGVVRWSAAKGVGRVTGRLPKELADEVVGYVLELFTPRESDGAWHGGCLALAELGRRGLLLPSRLPEVVPVVLKALTYDEPRGYSSVGSHIRDSACYVAWSFARAYETDILKPFVQDIASALLVVTCYDREINCRRAASAAFQENVGRQGTFPHGIDILTTADFFAVSVRNNAYLNISHYIAQFEEYTIALIDHLLERKVDHWDPAIRELTAKTLHILTPLAPKYMAETVMPELFTKAVCIDLNSRHGAIISIAEIFYALSKVAQVQKTPLTDLIDPVLITNAKTLILTFRERLYFRGLGGEIMKQGCSAFIEKCSLAHLPFHNDEIINDWLVLLEECLIYDVVNIRTAATNALPALLSEYYRNKEAIQLTLIKKFVEQMKSTTSQINRMGHSLALGALPEFMLVNNINIVVNALLESTVITQSTLKWSESRRDAIKALTSIFITMNDIPNGLSNELIIKIYECFLEALNEYTQDNRGDIGAWVREAAMIGMQRITLSLSKNRRDILGEQLVTRIATGIAQQAVEKIDRTRAIAGKIYYSFIHNTPAVPNIPNADDVSVIFNKAECDMLNWNSEPVTFPKFVQLIKFPQYSYSILLGLVSSVGGMTASLVKRSSASLFSYLQSEYDNKGSKEMERLCDIIYEIFLKYQKIDRITVPMLRFLDKLFCSGCIECVISNGSSEFPKKVLKLIQIEINGCKDTYKLIDGISILCQFMQIKTDVCGTALVQLSILLCHWQPYIRRSTSTKLYESLLIYGDSSIIPIENLDEIMETLSTTNWEQPVEEVKPTRNKLCTLMGIRIPVPKKKT